MSEVGLVYYFITLMGFGSFWASVLTVPAKSNRKLGFVAGFSIGVCMGVVLLSVQPTNITDKTKKLTELLIVVSSVILGICGALLHKGLKKT